MRVINRERNISTLISFFSFFLFFYFFHASLMLAAATTRLDEHCSADLHWMRVKTRITSDLVIDVFDCFAVILQTRLVFLESFAISFEDSRKKREREDFKSLYTLFFKKRILLTWERYINIERLERSFTLLISSNWYLYHKFRQREDENEDRSILHLVLHEERTNCPQLDDFQRIGQGTGLDTRWPFSPAYVGRKYTPLGVQPGVKVTGMELFLFQRPVH